MQVPEKLASLSLVERDDDHLVYVGSNTSQVVGLNNKLKEIVDQWTVGDQIVSMDNVGSEEGGVVFAIGTAQGKIILRYDWEEYPKKFECQKPINCVKFSHDGVVLAATSGDSSLYIFYR